MKFKLSEDIDAPRAAVWQSFTAFEALEGEMASHGVALSRVSDWSTVAQGVAWTGEAKLRGRLRAITGEITAYTPEELCVIESRIGGMLCHHEMRFIALSPATTRVAMVLDLSAQTLSARLVLQALKLSRKRIMQRFRALIVRRANIIETERKRAERAADPA